MERTYWVIEVFRDSAMQKQQCDSFACLKIGYLDVMR